MRIAIVSNVLPPDGLGGAELYVAALADSLAASHEVRVFCGGEEGEASAGAAKVVHLPGLPRLDPTAAFPRRAVWHARDQWLLSVHRALRSKLRRFAPDVIHPHEPQGLSGAVFTAVAASGAPHVHTAHDLNLLCAQVTMTRRGAFCGGHCVRCFPQRATRPRLLRRRLDALVCHSEYVRTRHLEARVCEPDKIVTIPFGVPPAKSRLRTGNGDLRVGFLGSLTTHKGVPTLLDAFRECPRTWRLAVAGAGPLEPLVRTRSGLDPRIEFAGFVSGDAKDAFLDGVDILVIPSEMEEATSLVAAEAGIRGIPSVVSNRGGLPEFPEVVVFEAGSTESLQAALLLYGDAPERLERASRALLGLRQALDWDTHVGRVASVLATAADTGRARKASSRASLDRDV
jgi:glycosyltransferase involved in cell wall biosynthesis